MNYSLNLAFTPKTGGRQAVGYIERREEELNSGLPNTTFCKCNEEHQ